MRTKLIVPFVSVLPLLASACGTPPNETSSDATATAATSSALISGTDDRIEAKSYADPKLSRLIYSVPGMWLAKTLTPNTDGTVTLSRLPYTKYADAPLCSNTKFYGQPRGEGLACTAFLVAPDMVATAQHCLTEWGWSWSDWRLVFGYQYDSLGLLPTRVPTKDVYTPVEVVGQSPDWAVLRLDREVPTWRPVFALDKVGRPDDSQFREFVRSVVAIGYGEGLPLKVSPNSNATTRGDDYFMTFVDILPGNSGSPILDVDNALVRGILSGQYVDDYVWDATASCYRLVSYPNTGSLDYAVEAEYAAPAAALIAPQGTIIEPSYKDATLAMYAPSAVVTQSGKELLFVTNADGNVLRKQRNTSGFDYSAWTQVPGYVSLASTPAAVASTIAGETWLFGVDSSGTMHYNLNWNDTTWTNWGVYDAPGKLIDAPAAFVLTAPTSGGVTTQVIVVSILTEGGKGYMKYITYTKRPTGEVFKIASDWQPGAYALQAVRGTITGYASPTDNAAVALAVGTDQHLNCLQGTLSSTVTTPPTQAASVTWTRCANAFPADLAVRSAHGVSLAGGSHLVFARGLDDRVVSVQRSTGAWSPWTIRSTRMFGTPSLVASQGTWWLYSLTADRRVAVF